MSSNNSRESQFDWPVCYQAEELLLTRLLEFLGRNAFARELAHRMREETGTLLLDWMDHLLLSEREEAALRSVGFIPDPSAETEPGRRALHHPSAMLPHVILTPIESDFPPVVAIRVESIDDFLKAHSLKGVPDGEPFSRFRRVLIAEENGARFEAVERRGYRGFVTASLPDGAAEAFLKNRELWLHRPREFANDSEGYRQAQLLLRQMVDAVGRDLACSLVFEGERVYWQSRNRAAQEQKARQDRLGLGWANHDHHTFRSSRAHFTNLMQVMEQLGFERRERYYAGSQAGWGAQILEQSVEKIVVFADVDLLPEETHIDFSREPLPPASRLGTVGLWVGLHGESFLGAGMHHLEARFDFELVREQLKQRSIGSMAPFSDFEFLKQAFTEGERWPVRRERAEALLRKGLITDEQFQKFLKEGALGSHLETLQRRGGFKGFNQQSVSAVIAATDPRRQGAPAAALASH